MVVTLPPFQRLVDAHWRDVARLAHALAGPDGDDVAQQAWTQALAAYPSLRSARNLRGWLLTTTARCATDVHRRRGRDAVPVAEPPEPPGPSAADPIVDPVWAAVSVLPARQRTAVVMRYVGDLEHRDIAAAMGTTPAATRRLVSDALTTLRPQLGGPR